ncbi:MAG: hypothetical protein QXI27_02645 [Nitrososphaerota archaeon]
MERPSRRVQYPRSSRMIHEREPRLIIYVSEEIHKKLKVLSASSGLTMGMLSDAFINYVLRNKELTRRLIEDMGGRWIEQEET